MYEQLIPHEQLTILEKNMPHFWRQFANGQKLYFQLCNPSTSNLVFLAENRFEAESHAESRIRNTLETTRHIVLNVDLKSILTTRYPTTLAILRNSPHCMEVDFPGDMPCFLQLSGAIYENQLGILGNQLAPSNLHPGWLIFLANLFVAQ